MITAQQVRPAQVSPYGTVTGMQDISTILASIMPLIMIMMVMMIVGTP
jgi:hypothetical protein